MALRIHNTFGTTCRKTILFTVDFRNHYTAPQYFLQILKIRTTTHISEKVINHISLFFVIEKRVQTGYKKGSNKQWVHGNGICSFFYIMSQIREIRIITRKMICTMYLGVFEAQFCHKPICFTNR